MRLHDAQWITRYHVARFIMPKSEAPPPLDLYYPQQVSCVIPNLHELLTRFLGQREEGVFVEVGAYDGVEESNTWGLAARGWRGLMVEPVPSTAAACRENHRGHKGVEVVEYAVGSADDVDVPLHVGGVLTTASADKFEEYKRNSCEITDDVIVVRGRRLDTLLSESSFAPDFDLLVVDTEGFESEVFRGFDLARWQPRMMIVELVDTHPTLKVTASADAALGLSISDAGYVVVFKDGLNTVFVRRDVYCDAYELGSESGTASGG